MKALACALFFPALTLVADEPATPVPFSAPANFTVTQFAGDDLAHDIWAMTFDEQNRVVVSGPGYIKFLLDTDADNIADKAQTFASPKHAPQGMIFDGPNLIAVEKDGIKFYRDENNDLQADAPPDTWLTFPGGGGEHGPHAIRRGPDGWYYIICGNSTGINESHAQLDSSPIEHPNQGALIRVAPDGSTSEVLADGFRNPYDFAFNRHGDIFTYDSDGERDHHLPWYAPTRVFHVRPGARHGWLNGGYKRSFNLPPYFPDVADRLIETGRGSPTGVEVYRHTAFPDKYHDGIFLECWTYGRIYFAPLVPDKDTNSYLPQIAEIFIEPSGNDGAAPSDLAIHPGTGDLFFTVGGRNTTGAIYRVSHLEGPSPLGPPPAYYTTPPTWSIHTQTIPPFKPLSPENALAQLSTPDLSEDKALTAIRALQLALGDILPDGGKTIIDAGYSANNPDALGPENRTRTIDTFIDIFPTGHATAADEIARTLAMLRADHPEIPAKFTPILTPDSHPTRDAHYLFCLAHITSPRPDTARKAIAQTFLIIDQKIAARELFTSRNWNLNLAAALQANLAHDPPLAQAMLAHPAFGHPLQTYLCRALPDDLHPLAAEKLLNQSNPDSWTPDLIAFLIKELPPETLLPSFRRQFSAQPALRINLASFLGKHGADADKALVAEAFPPPEPAAFSASLQEKLTKAPWDAGDPARGKLIYTNLACAACHDQSTRLGPSLKGIANRFSRGDLFRHIDQPNLAISDLYKAVQITTRDGETHVGMPVYNSPDQTILETGLGATIRFSKADIAEEKPAAISPMPPGLLLSLTPAQLADLYAHLKSL